MDKKTLEIIAIDIEQMKSQYAEKLIQTKDRRYLRLVGELNAAYNHCVAAIAGDGNIYCLLKHISTAIVLAGEVDGDAAALYQIMAVISGDKIQPCSACRQDASGIIEVETLKGEEDESKDSTNLNLDEKEG